MANLVAYGFIDLEDLFSRRVTEMPAGQINTAIAASAAEWSRLMTEVMAVFVGRTTAAEEHYNQPAGGTLQPLDEWGNPFPVQGGVGWDVGYPIQGGGTAWGTNRVSRELMTVEEANAQTIAAQNRDADWLYRHVLGSLLDNTSWNFTDKTRPNDPTVTVKPLANGDTDVFMFNNGQPATDNHYSSQAAAISDAANPVPGIVTELTEHPGNGKTVVAYVASSLTAGIMGLANFVGRGDPDIQLVAGTTLTRDGEEFLGPGQRVLGKVDGAWIVEWDRLPTGYIVATAPEADGKPVAMREYPAASLQGLFTENHSPDGNLREQRMIRYAGFGVRNRTAAYVYFVGNAAYQIPAGFVTPMPL